MQYYDIVGDIHGHATQLESLLMTMDYQLLDGTYKHQIRKAIFVGDFIDGGKENRKVIEIVKSMVKNNTALAIMGNHEFNAICYATHHNERADEYLRPHNEENFNQHETFLSEFPLGTKRHAEAINWFKTLPVYLDLKHLRIIHACWHEPSLIELNESLNDDKTIPDSMYITGTDRSHQDYFAIENTIKGVEQTLPKGMKFITKGKERTEIRVKWWCQSEPSYINLALSVPESLKKQLPDKLVQPKPFIYSDECPVFFGHYWMTGEPSVQSDFVACVDYSVAKGGELTAYRWSGEKKLKTENFINSQSKLKGINS